MGDKVDFESYNPSWDTERRCLNPLVEVRETDDEMIVTVDLPFVKKENIELSVTEDLLKIKAQMDRDIRFKSWGGVHRKIKFNSFRRSIKFPSKVDPDQTKAEFKNGYLRVIVKKKTGKKVDIQ